MPASKPSRRFSRLLGRLGVLRLMASIVALGVFMALTGAAPASAATFQVATKSYGYTLKGGPGHPQPVHFGLWKQGNRTGPCGAFAKSTPDSSGLVLLNGVHPGTSALVSAELDFLVNKYSSTTSNVVAGDLAGAVWKVQGSPTFKTYYAWAVKTGVLSAARVRAIELMIGEAQQAASGYNLSVKADNVGVGHIGDGSLVLFTRRGTPAIGADVVVQATNAVILSVNGRPGNRGVTSKLGAHFTFKPLRMGKDYPVSFKAVAYTPSTRQVLKSNAQAGHQFIFTGNYRDNLVATYSYVITPGDTDTATTCDSDCNGMSTVTFSTCNAKGGDAVQYTKYVDSAVVATLNVAAGTCASTTARLADASIVTGTVCYTGTTVGGPCVSNVVKLPGSYEVVCPAWAKKVLTVVCDCTISDGTLAMTVPATLGGGTPNSRRYVGYVTIGSNAVQTFPMVIGVTKTVELGNLPVGTVVTHGFIVYHDADPASAEIFRHEWRSIPNA